MKLKDYIKKVLRESPETEIEFDLGLDATGEVTDDITQNRIKFILFNVKEENDNP